MNMRQFIMAAITTVAFTGPSGATTSQTLMTIYKDPTCGCCGDWASAVANAGFKVDTLEVDDLIMIKKKYKVPHGLESCHTAILGPYVIEGHLPLQAIEKLLSEQPKFTGLAVAGMPPGSLGMGNDPSASYGVIAFEQNGTHQLYLQMP